MVDQDGHDHVPDHRVNQIQREAYIGQEVEDFIFLESVSAQIAGEEKNQRVAVIPGQRAEQLMFIESVDGCEQDVDRRAVTERGSEAKLVAEGVVEQAAKEHKAQELGVRDQARDERCRVQAVGGKVRGRAAQGQKRQGNQRNVVRAPAEQDNQRKDQIELYLDRQRPGDEIQRSDPRRAVQERKITDQKRQTYSA